MTTLWMFGGALAKNESTGYLLDCADCPCDEGATCDFCTSSNAPSSVIIDLRDAAYEGDGTGTECDDCNLFNKCWELTQAAPGACYWRYRENDMICGGTINVLMVLTLEDVGANFRLRLVLSWGDDDKSYDAHVWHYNYAPEVTSVDCIDWAELPLIFDTTLFNRRYHAFCSEPADYHDPGGDEAPLLSAEGTGCSGGTPDPPVDPEEPDDDQGGVAAFDCPGFLGGPQNATVTITAAATCTDLIGEEIPIEWDGPTAQSYSGSASLTCGTGETIEFTMTDLGDGTGEITGIITDGVTELAQFTATLNFATHVQCDPFEVVRQVLVTNAGNSDCCGAGDHTITFTVTE